MTTCRALVPVVLVLTAVPACSRRAPEAPVVVAPAPVVVAPVAVAVSDFAPVLDRLAQWSKAQSNGTTSVTVVADPDGLAGADQPNERTVRLRRVRADGPGAPVTTEYTVQFRRVGDRWVCVSAVAKEQGSGFKNENAIHGPNIEMDQLLIWLGS